jgi:glycosyltransferase involved in cell wall biosynthesis/SAM-dependent methyltransferase
MKNKILILTRYARLGASSRYRFYDFKDILEENENECTYSPLLSNQYLIKTYSKSYRFIEILKCYLKRLKVLFTTHKYDLCLIEKELFPFVPYFIESLFLSNSKRYIIDYDDATFHRYDEHKSKIIRYLLSKKISLLMANASSVWVGNQYLYDYANKYCHNEIKIIPTVVDFDKYSSIEVKKDKQFTIVWIGSQSTVRYLYEVIEPLKRIFNSIDAKLIVIGASIDIPNLNIELIEWSEETEVQHLKSASVGIMPLSKDNWDKGKCGFKIIQYMASGVPVIASPIGVNKKIIQHEINGFLANTSEEWFDYLLQIYNGVDLKIISSAKNTVKESYSKKYASKILLNSIDEVLKENFDLKVVKDFGHEWGLFQNEESRKDLKKIWGDYFNIFPWSVIPNNAIGADIGCGTGRWAIPIANRVQKLYLIDPSYHALEIAKKNMNRFDNVEFINKGVDSAMPLIEPLDFAYSLGVLHHIPNISSAFKAISANLKKGAPFLIYLYHSFDDSPAWYKTIWLLSDFIRKIISQLPYRVKIISTQLIALFIYFPISRLGYILSKLGFKTKNFPLIYYSDKPYYFMKNDSLDRFGTKLENRFSRDQIVKLYEEAGFIDVKFSTNKPYWCAVATKAK